MAPRFKQNMYQTYTKDVGADALICFPFSNDAFGWFQSNFILPFRDKLTEKISSATNLYLLKHEGFPTKADSWFSFFNSEDDIVFRNELPSKYSTGFRDWLFKTKKYKEFKKDEQKMEQLVQTEILTSHDHPCIVVYSSIHSEDSLSGLIETIAKGLNIDMPKNSKLPSITDIICSNRTFDIIT
jgi:hypothetical protein